MKVIVFGGSGFLGSHVASALTDFDYEVVIFDKIESQYLEPGQEMVVGNILDEATVAAAVKGCDIVYNFAGIADLDKAAQNPVDSVKANVLGNIIILDACRNVNVKRFVFASSLYVYSKSGSFYRSTKQACELFIENYHEIFGLPYTILRYGSLYGPRANERNFIYRILTQALKEGKIIRDGDGEELREYIHVRDAARGSIEILSPEFENQYIILTGHQQIRVKDLLFMIREMFDKRIDIEYLPSTQSYHYDITPYSFSPKVGRRLTSQGYLDLGQGLLELIYELYQEINTLPTYDGIIVRNNKAHNNNIKHFDTFDLS